MSVWPLVIALIILAVATIMFFMMPSIIDFEMSFLWIAGLFIVIYIGAALYLTRYFSTSSFRFQSVAPSPSQESLDTVSVSP